MSAILLTALSLLPQGPLQVLVTPRGKEPIAATWTVSTVTIDTEFGSAIVKAGKLAQIQFGPPDVVVTEGGTELRGELKSRTLELKVDGKPRRFTGNDVTLLVVVRDGKALGVPQFGGEWMTSFGPAKLEQRGTGVKGDFGFGSSGTIEGKIKDGKLQFTYQGDSGSGGGTWTLWDGDGAFTGGYAEGKDEGFWGGYRKVAFTPALKPGEVVAGQTQAGLRFHVRVPKAHQAGSRWPAICILHGSNMDSRSYVDTIVATWPQLAEQYAVVGLDGERLSQGSKQGALRFNYTYINFSGPDVGPLWMHRQSPALVADSLRQLQKELPIDHWYLGGHSQGGFLCYCLVMYYPELLAGAFPMSCNLLVQCEPDEFDSMQRALQHRVPLAVVHGRKDDVVEFSGGAYCHLRLLDGGFPSLRLFAPEEVGHQFAWLPVEAAVQWLRQSRSSDPAELLAFAEARAGEKAWRDVGAALQRLLANKPPAALADRVVGLQRQFDAAAAPKAKELASAIEKDRDGRWVDSFLSFRAEFASAAPAVPVLAAYDALRQQQKKAGDELFQKARGTRDKAEREAIYKKLMAECFATKWYAAVKLWLGG